MNRIEQLDDETIQLLFGAEAAEDDDPQRLREFFFKGDVYNRITARLPLRILVGHKGIGKSALFTIAIQEQRESGEVPILIQPSDLVDLGRSEDDFIKRIQEWKAGLNRIIVDKVLKSIGVDDASAAERLKRYGGGLVAFLLDVARPIADKSINVSPAQLALRDGLLKSQSVTVYLDDLDRGWEGTRTDITRISALLNACRDINNENKNIRFKIALRSDVYFLVRTSDESTDKTESAVVWYSWTNHEILALLVKRIETFFGRPAREADLIKADQTRLGLMLSPVMDTRFYGRGKWQNIPTHRMLMTLIRKEHLGI